MQWMGMRMLLGGLLMGGLAGCGFLRPSFHPATPQPSQRAPSNSVATKSKTPSQTITSGSGYTPVRILDGASFTLSVPSAKSVTQPSVADVPQGVLWLTPPDFRNGQGRRLHHWHLWLTPWRPSGGSLWINAESLVRFGKIANLSMIAMTSNQILLGDRASKGSIRPILVNLTDHTLKILPNTWSLNSPHTVGNGVLAWASGSEVDVVNVTTGQTNHYRVSSIIRTLTLSSGGVTINGHTVAMSAVPTLSPVTLPTGFQWLTANFGVAPVALAPQGWTVKEMPGGSSQGVMAFNPIRPDERVEAWVNACVGCYWPAGTSRLVQSPFDSPLLATSAGESFTWVNTHVVAYTIPPKSSGGNPTFGVTATWPNASGNENIAVTVPVKDKPLATEILNAALSLWRAHTYGNG